MVNLPLLRVELGDDEVAAIFQAGVVLGEDTLHAVASGSEAGDAADRPRLTRKCASRPEFIVV